MDRKKFHVKNKSGTKLFFALLPFIVLYTVLCYFPINGWRYAFYKYKPGMRLENCEFVGFKYFTEMFLNPVLRRHFLQVMKNTFFFSFLGIATSFIPMFFAIFINEIKSRKMQKFVQTCTTIPYFISWVMVYAVIFMLFSTDGFVNALLIKLGILDEGVNYMAAKAASRFQMWGYSLWKSLGWNAIIYLAALGGIDQELYEAAAIDGAGRFKKIRYVTIPGLMPTFITLLIMSIGNFLSVGMEQYLIFSNAFNAKYIETLDLYVYNQGILKNNIPSSTAIGIYKSLIGLVLLAIANGLSGKLREEKIF